MQKLKIQVKNMANLINLNAEFEELPDAVQHDLINRNGPRGLALTVARYESCDNGLDQGPIP